MMYDDVVEDEDLNLVVTAPSEMRNFRARATKGGLGVLVFKPELLETHLLRYSHQPSLTTIFSFTLYILPLIFSDQEITDKSLAIKTSVKTNPFHSCMCKCPSLPFRHVISPRFSFPPSSFYFPGR